MIAGPGWAPIVACALSWAVPSRGEPTQTVILLRNTTGAIALRALAGAHRADGKTGIEVAGLDYWAVDERKNAVLAVGSEAALKELRQVIELVDVRPRTVRIVGRFLRTERDDAGKLTTTEIGTPTVTALNNTEASVSVGHGAVTLTATVVARVNGEGTVTMTADFGASRHRGSGLFVRSTKRLRQGDKAVFAWLPDIWGKDAQLPAPLGAHPVKAGELPGVYLELSAQAVEAPR